MKILTKKLLQTLEFVTLILILGLSLFQNLYGQAKANLYTLKNGLKVVILPSDSAINNNFLVHIHLIFKAGSTHDVKFGTAHFLEHMYMRAPGVNGNSYIEELSNFGIARRFFDGKTRFDYTEYHATLPAKHIKSYLKIQANRMKFLNVKIDFDIEKKIIKSERMWRIDSNDVGNFLTKVYKNIFQYEARQNFSSLGTLKEIEAITPDVVSMFHKSYYAPNNALLIIVGNIDIKKTISDIKKLFGKLKPKSVKLFGRGEDKNKNYDLHLSKFTNIKLNSTQVVCGLQLVDFKSTLHNRLILTALQSMMYFSLTGQYLKFENSLEYPELKFRINYATQPRTLHFRFKPQLDSQTNVQNHKFIKNNAYLNLLLNSIVLHKDKNLDIYEQYKKNLEIQLSNPQTKTIYAIYNIKHAFLNNTLDQDWLQLLNIKSTLNSITIKEVNTLIYRLIASKRRYAALKTASNLSKKSS